MSFSIGSNIFIYQISDSLRAYFARNLLKNIGLWYYEYEREQSLARPPPPAQLLDERRGWTL